MSEPPQHRRVLLALLERLRSGQKTVADVAALRARFITPVEHVATSCTEHVATSCNVVATQHAASEINLAALAALARSDCGIAEAIRLP